MAKAAEVVLQLRAENAQYLAKMRQSEAQFTRSLGNIQRRAGATGAFLKTTFAGLFAGVSLAGVQNLLDASTRIQNALKVTGLEGDDLSKVYDRLFESAQKNAVPLEDLVTLYSRASMAAANLGASHADLESFTNNVGLALRVSGKSASEASGALLQLSQLLGGNMVQAQEYNSLIDGAFPLLQAVAAGLKEAGGDVGKLTALVKSGKVPVKAFFDAFQVGSVVLEQKVASSTQTVSAGFVKIYNTLVDAVGKIDKGTDSSQKLANALDQIAKSIGSMDLSIIEDELAGISSKINKTIEDWNRWVAAYLAVKKALSEGDLSGAADAAAGFFIDTTTAEQKVEALERDVKLLQDTIAKNTDLGFDNTEALARLAEVQAKIAQTKADAATLAANDIAATINEMVPFNPLRPLTQSEVVSLADPKYKVDPDDSKKSKKERRNEWERETAQIKERTAAIQAETAAMAGLNPLIDDYGFAVEFAAAKQELLSAAKAAGLEVMPDLSAAIDDLAGKYANAGVQAEILAESQDEVRERAEEMRDFGKDVFGGFISDIVQGKSAADALADALGKIGDKLLDIAMNSLFDGGGILGSLFGGGFGTKSGFADMLGVPGRASGGPVSAGQPYIVGEKRPELFVPNQSGRIIPSVPKLSSPGGVAGGGSIVVQFSPTIDNRGASVEAVAQTAQQLAKMKAELPAMVIQAVRQANKRNVKFG